MNFNFETIGYNNSSAHELLSNKFAKFLCFMAENDVKCFYWSTYFFDKSKVALEFLQHRGSKLKFINLERNY